MVTPLGIASSARKPASRIFFCEIVMWRIRVGFRGVARQGFIVVVEHFPRFEEIWLFGLFRISFYYYVLVLI